MQKVAMVLIGVSGLAFLVAVVLALMGVEGLLGVGSEGYSRTCSNLALIAIALGVWFKESGENA